MNYCQNLSWFARGYIISGLESNQIELNWIEWNGPRETVLCAHKTELELEFGIEIIQYAIHFIIQSLIQCPHVLILILWTSFSAISRR